MLNKYMCCRYCQKRLVMHTVYSFRRLRAAPSQLAQSSRCYARSQPRRLNRRIASLPLALLVSLVSSASLHPPQAALSFGTRFASLLHTAHFRHWRGGVTEPRGGRLSKRLPIGGFIAEAPAVPDEAMRRLSRRVCKRSAAPRRLSQMEVADEEGWGGGLP